MPAPPQLQPCGPVNGWSGWFSQTQPVSSQTRHFVASVPHFAVGPFFYHTDPAFFLHLRSGQRSQMPAYKVYVLRDDGHVISEVDLFCDGGVEKAKEIAQGLVDENPVELWDGSTRIAPFEPWHGPHANRSAPAGVKRT
jgi:hypothetical protein